MLHEDEQVGEVHRAVVIQIAGQGKEVVDEIIPTNPVGVSIQMLSGFKSR